MGISRELSRRSGCWLLFDVNNVYVSAFNHAMTRIPPQRDPQGSRGTIPHGRPQPYGTHIIDTHDHPVCEDVWDLYVAG